MGGLLSLRESVRLRLAPTETYRSLSALPGLFHRVWRVLRIPFWLLLGTSIGFLAPYLIYLDSQVRARFDDLSWDLPSRVYARPLELTPGLPMSAEALALELEASRYASDASARMPG